MIYIFAFLLRIALASDVVVISPGTNAELKTSPGQIIRIEKTDVIKVKDLGSKIKVIGKKIGTAQIGIGSQVYKIWVVRSATYSTFQKLKKWQKNKRGPEISVENHQLQVRGRILTLDDWQDLSNIMDENDDYTIRAKIDKILQQQIEKRIKQLLEENNLAFSYLAMEPSWTLNLAKTSGDELKNYRRILSGYGIEIKDSPQAIKSLPLIEVSIVAAEIQRSEMRRFGVQWPSATPFQVLPQFNTPQASVLATIQHIEENGKGRILAKPTLISQSGEEATFHSGGEFPIKAISQFQSNVVWKKYGLLLKIKPRADNRGKMDLQIDCEFSSPDSREDDGGIYGLIVHRVTSHFNLEESKTIALSGLIKEEWRKNTTGLPWLAQVPLLSPLFSSEHYQNNQSELVFFVTPRVIR